MTTIKERFADRFIFQDTGPDGDGYDVEPDKWNEDWPADHDAQVEAIYSFFRKELLDLAADFDRRGLEGEVLIKSLADELI